MKPHIIDIEDKIRNEKKVAIEIFEYIKDFSDCIEPEFDIHNDSIGAYDYGSSSEIQPDRFSLECTGNKYGQYIYQIDLPEPYSTLEVFAALNAVIAGSEVVRDGTYTFICKKNKAHHINYTVELNLQCEIIQIYSEPVIFIRAEWRDRQ